MSEQGDFNELPLNDSNRRAILEIVPVLETLAYFLQTGYLSNDPGCETFAWRQVRAARNHLWSAIALLNGALEADQPKNLPPLAGG